MVTVGKNFSGQTTPSIIDTEYHKCNFSQPDCVNNSGDMEGVRIFPGDDTPRTFVHCNMTNCEPPPGSSYDSCNSTIKGDPEVKNSEEIYVDSVYIATAENIVEYIYGKWTEGGYVYLPTPKEKALN